uniref:Uncharacterized protein n=1 Tax=viral metagenome TaxID=1070528 RepID=A0A6C0ITS6_9ZZZZ
MDNIFLLAGFISGIFCLAKFFEMRYVDDEPKPLKLLIRDSLIVYVSVICGIYVIEQLSPVVNDTIQPPSIKVFTDEFPL